MPPSSRPHRRGRAHGQRTVNSHSRPHSGNTTRRHGHRGGQRGSQPTHRRGRGQRKETPIDISRFINEAPKEKEHAHVAPSTIHTFKDFALLPSLMEAIGARGYTAPTPIQDKIIPHILRGKDVVGLSNTGTGKTAAFLIPLIQKLLLLPHEQILVLAPTRELALQIDEEFRGFARGLKLHSVVCVGGMPIGPQLRRLRFRNHIIIGTPGRVMDLMARGALMLSNTGTVVLDEADRMLDMGFINDVRHILSHLPQERHTLFFSATLSPAIEKLIHDFLRDPVSISVKTRLTAETIYQDVVRVNGRDKVEVLIELLRRDGFEKVIIFGRTKHGVEKLSRLLIQRGIKADSLHGNKNHNQRVRALEAFRRGHVQALIATDVAARGLDIDNVSHVINYDMPATYEDYIHRIGRTGRATKRGYALTFIDEHE